MICFLSQYYRGLGHAMRTKYISDMLPQDSFIVIDQLYSPPIKYNTKYTYYLEERPDKVSNDFKYLMKQDKVRQRAATLKKLINNNDISILVCEGFPFCRQQFSYEYFSALETAKEKGIKIVISIRDYPWDEPQYASIQDWVAKTINYVIETFDCNIIVHGDDKYLPLMSDATRNYYWSELYPDIDKRLYYTGYVCNPDIKQHKKEDNNVYISCGLNKEESFFIYNKILKSVAKRFPDLHFNVVLGNSELHQKIGDKSSKNVTIHNYIPNLSKHLETCTAYITYGGYNSTTDILKAKIPSIIIPRQDGHKLEQLIRCYLFKEYGMFKVCSYYELPRIYTLLSEILEDDKFPYNNDLNLEGAINSARYLQNI